MSKIIKVDCGIHFRLREPKASSQTPVVCFIEYNGKPVIKIPTGLKIKPAEWHSEKEKPLTGLRGLKSTQAHLFNSRISAIRHTVETLFREYIMKYNDYPDKAQYKKDVLRELFGEPDDKTVIVKDPCFLNFISGQIVQAKSGNRVKLSGNGKGARFANDTIKDYTVVLNLLQRFLVYIGKSSISFDEITLEFYKKLQQYMYEEMEYSLNYFGKIVKSIKAFMREAQELGYHNNETYKSNRFIKPQEETDAIYLNTDQLETILQLDLSKSKSLENARDLFLVGCWTGLRFSDFSELSNHDVIKGDFIHELI